jgi:hypothetical protein
MRFDSMTRNTTKIHISMCRTIRPFGALRIKVCRFGM